MAGATMAAPIAVHASPNKWSGQPTREHRGTGEGGAAYGEGLYATVPQNAVGVDRRYRADTGSFHVWDVPDRLMDYDAPLAKQSPEVQGSALSAGVKGRRYADQEGTLSFSTRERAHAVAARHQLHPSEYEVVGPNGWGSFEVRSKDPMAQTGRQALEQLARGGERQATDKMTAAGIQGHTYAGEAGSARTSGIEGDVPNFVIYDDAAVKPLGTFGSADEWLQSDLYRKLKARIDAEDALRKAGQATPEAYDEIRRRFAEAIGNAGR
jgi:hypothetical protein